MKAESNPEDAPGMAWASWEIDAVEVPA